MNSCPHILIDILHIRNSLHTGIANVAVGVIQGFVKYSDWNITILTWEGLGKAVDEIAGIHLKKIYVPVSQQSYLDKKLNIKRCPQFLIDQIEAQHIQLVFTTCYTINSYIFPKQFNQVGYVMDMQSITLRRLRGQWLHVLYHWIYYTIYLRLVDHILCISDSTTEDVKKLSGVSATTVYININHVIAKKDIKPINGLDNYKYILDVNSFMDYKNPERLITAFAKIKDKIPHRLYMKGYGCDDKRFKELSNHVESLGVSDRVILDINNRTSEEMAYLFEHASLFVSPSLMEGFGLTPIEAVIHGCPTVVSNIKTLVEVTDHRVKTFNPYSVDSIATVILEAINNPLGKEEIEQIALHYKERYSLKKQIESYEQIFKNILNGRKNYQPSKG